MHDAIHESRLEEELGGLESLRQVLPDRVADDAGSGETDVSRRLGQYDVADATAVSARTSESHRMVDR